MKTLVEWIKAIIISCIIFAILMFFLAVVATYVGLVAAGFLYFVFLFVLVYVWVRKIY